MQAFASNLFWFAATLYMIVAIALAAVATSRAGRRHARTEAVSATASQRKDNWLACAAIWLTLLSDGMPYREILLLAGTLVMAWLARRAAQRLTALAASGDTRRP